MGFFTERKQRSEDARIAEFWAWWAADGAARTAAVFDGVDEDGREAVVAELIRRVEALDPDIQFETGAGRDARHLLVVTGVGGPLTAFAGRWLAAAPGVSDAWEYADARQAAADPSELVLGYADQQIDVASARVCVVEAGERLDVGFSHPAFAALSHDDQGKCAFILLDAVLGEEAVERWLGAVEWSVDAGVGARPLVELRAVVEGFADRG